MNIFKKIVSVFICIIFVIDGLFFGAELLDAGTKNLSPESFWERPGFSALLSNVSKVIQGIRNITSQRNGHIDSDLGIIKEALASIIPESIPMDEYSLFYDRKSETVALYKFSRETNDSSDFIFCFRMSDSKSNIFNGIPPDSVSEIGGLVIEKYLRSKDVNNYLDRLINSGTNNEDAKKVNGRTAKAAGADALDESEKRYVESQIRDNDLIDIELPEDVIQLTMQRMDSGTEFVAAKVHLKAVKGISEYGFSKGDTKNNPQDLIYVYGKPADAKGEIDIYITEGLFDKILKDNNQLLLAELIDHEWHEIIVASCIGIPEKLRHRYAASRARYFVESGNTVSAFHEFVINRILLYSTDGIEFLKKVLNEVRQYPQELHIDMLAVKSYEKDFRKKIESSISQFVNKRIRDAFGFIRKNYGDNNIALLERLIFKYSSYYLTSSYDLYRLANRLRKYHSRILREVDSRMLECALQSDGYGRVLFLMIWKGSLKELVWKSAKDVRELLTARSIDTHKLTNAYSGDEAEETLRSIAGDEHHREGLIQKTSDELEYLTGYNILELLSDKELVRIFADEIMSLMRAGRQDAFEFDTDVSIKISSRNLNSLKAGDRAGDCTRVGQFNHWASGSWEAVFENIGLEVYYKGKVFCRIVALVAMKGDWQPTLWVHAVEFSPLAREGKSVFQGLAQAQMINLLVNALKSYAGRAGISKVLMTGISNSFGMQNLLTQKNGQYSNMTISLINGMNSGMSILFKSVADRMQGRIAMYFQGWRGSTSFGMTSGLKEIREEDSVLIGGYRFSKDVLDRISTVFASELRDVFGSARSQIAPMENYGQLVQDNLLRQDIDSETAVGKCMQIIGGVVAQALNWVEIFDPGNMELGEDLNKIPSISVKKLRFWRERVFPKLKPIALNILSGEEFLKLEMFLKNIAQRIRVFREDEDLYCITVDRTEEDDDYLMSLTNLDGDKLRRIFGGVDLEILPTKVKDYIEFEDLRWDFDRITEEGIDMLSPEVMKLAEYERREEPSFEELDLPEDLRERLAVNFVMKLFLGEIRPKLNAETSSKDGFSPFFRIKRSETAFDHMSIDIDKKAQRLADLFLIVINYYRQIESGTMSEKFELFDKGSGVLYEFSGLDYNGIPDVFFDESGEFKIEYFFSLLFKALVFNQVKISRKQESEIRPALERSAPLERVYKHFRQLFRQLENLDGYDSDTLVNIAMSLNPDWRNELRQKIQDHAISAEEKEILLDNIPILIEHYRQQRERGNSLEDSAHQSVVTVMELPVHPSSNRNLPVASQMKQEGENGNTNASLTVGAIALDGEIARAFSKGEAVSFVGSLLPEIVSKLDSAVKGRNIFNKSKIVQEAINLLVSGIRQESYFNEFLNESYNAGQKEAKIYLNKFLQNVRNIKILRDSLAVLLRTIQSSSQKDSIMGRRIVIFTGNNPLYFKEADVFGHAGTLRNSIYLHMNHIKEGMAFMNLVQHEDWHLTDEGKEAVKERHAWQSEDECEYVLEYMIKLKALESIVGLRPDGESGEEDEEFDFGDIGEPGEYDRHGVYFTDIVNEQYSYAESAVKNLETKGLSVEDYLFKLSEALTVVLADPLFGPILCRALMEKVKAPSLDLNACIAASIAVQKIMQLKEMFDTSSEYIYEDISDGIVNCLKRQDFANADTYSLFQLTSALLIVAEVDNKFELKVLNIAEEILMDSNSSLNLCHAIAKLLLNLHHKNSFKIKKSLIRALVCGAVTKPYDISKNNTLNELAFVAVHFAEKFAHKHGASVADELVEAFCIAKPVTEYGLPVFMAIVSFLSEKIRELKVQDFPTFLSMSERIIKDTRTAPTTCMLFFTKFGSSLLTGRVPEELYSASSVTVDAIEAALVRRDVAESNDDEYVIKEMYYTLGVVALRTIMQVNPDLQNYVIRALFRMYNNPNSDIILKQEAGENLGVPEDITDVNYIDDFSLQQKVFRDYAKSKIRGLTEQVQFGLLLRIAMEAPGQFEEETVISLGRYAVNDWLERKDYIAIGRLFAAVNIFCERYSTRIAGILQQLNNPVINEAFGEIIDGFRKATSTNNASLFSISESYIRPEMQEIFARGEVAAFQGSELNSIIELLQNYKEDNMHKVIQILAGQVFDYYGIGKKEAYNFLERYISDVRNRNYLLRQLGVLMQVVERSEQKDSIKQRRIVVFLGQGNLFSDALILGHAGIARNSIYLHVDHIEDSDEFMYLVQHEDWHLTGEGKKANSIQHAYKTDEEERKVLDLLRRRILDLNRSSVDIYEYIIDFGWLDDVEYGKMIDALKSRAKTEKGDINPIVARVFNMLLIEDNPYLNAIGTKEKQGCIIIDADFLLNQDVSRTELEKLFEIFNENQLAFVAYTDDVLDKIKERFSGEVFVKINQRIYPNVTDVLKKDGISEVAFIVSSKNTGKAGTLKVCVREERNGKSVMAIPSSMLAGNIIEKISLGHVVLANDFEFMELSDFYKAILVEGIKDYLIEQGLIVNAQNIQNILNIKIPEIQRIDKWVEEEYRTLLDLLHSA